MKQFGQKQILICVFLFFSSLSFAQTAEDILHRYLDTVSYGDIAKWSRIKTLYATTIIYFDADAFQSRIGLLNSVEASYKKIYKIWPDRQKEELYQDSAYAGSPSKFYYLKNKHVIILNNGMPPMETPAKTFVQFEFYPVRVQAYIQQAKEIKLNSIKRIPGKASEYFEILIKTQDDSHYLLINTDTYLLEGIFFPETNTYWTLADYKTFDGYLIPTRYYDVKNGIVVSTQIFTSFRLNVPIDVKIFDPPN
jgi:hypothetical protein